MGLTQRRVDIQLLSVSDRSTKEGVVNLSHFRSLISNLRERLVREVPPEKHRAPASPFGQEVAPQP